MIRCTGISLRNRENIQGESATKVYVQDINLSQALEQSGRNGNVRKEGNYCQCCVRHRRTRRSHSRDTSHGCGRLETGTLCAFPEGRYLHPGAWCTERKLGVRMVTASHVTAAVSCCLEMALWRTLWMVDQVSLTAGGGLSASRNR